MSFLAEYRRELVRKFFLGLFCTEGATNSKTGPETSTDVGWVGCEAWDVELFRGSCVLRSP